MIRNATLADAKAICRIYNPFIEETIVSFEETLIDAAEMQQRMQNVMKNFPWLILEEDGEILGYAYAGYWRTRIAYRFTVESTIYLAPHAIGKGYGRQLYTVLLEQLKEIGIRMVMGCISLPNPASVALHEKLGFDKVGYFPQVGYKFEQWIDVGYWQKML